MRTTVRLDDGVVEVVNRYADARSMSVGKALSELVRRGAEAPPKTHRVNGLMVFDLPADTEKVTTRQVKRLLESVA